MNFQERLERELEWVLRDFDKLLIPYSKEISQIKVNTRARARFGCCRRYNRSFGKDYFVIEISSFVEDATDEKLKNIIAHEVLHTVEGCYNHGKKWKSMANALNEGLGYNITTTTTYDKVGIIEPKGKEEFQYEIKCLKCGKVIFRKRSCNLTKHTGRYRCGFCGGKLKTTSLNKTK